MGGSLQRAINGFHNDKIVRNSIWSCSNLIRRLMFLSMCNENEFVTWWKAAIVKLHNAVEKSDVIAIE